MKRRHTGQMGGGMNHHNNRRPQGKFNPNYNSQRPRKNYPALREKYMSQARDAMNSGDRVLAEYYLQHADHCHRMQQEYMAERAARFPQQQAQQGGGPADMQEPEETGPVEEEVNLSGGGSALPAFITRPATPQQAPQGEQPAPQHWEEE